MLREKNSIETWRTNLLARRLEGYDVELERTEYPEKNSRRLVIHLDIIISRRGTSLFIIDTKYQKFSAL